VPRPCSARHLDSRGKWPTRHQQHPRLPRHTFAIAIYLGRLGLLCKQRLGSGSGRRTIAQSGSNRSRGPDCGFLCSEADGEAKLWEMCLAMANRPGPVLEPAPRCSPLASPSSRSSGMSKVRVIVAHTNYFDKWCDYWSSGTTESQAAWVLYWARNAEFRDTAAFLWDTTSRLMAKHPTSNGRLFPVGGNGQRNCSEAQ